VTAFEEVLALAPSHAPALVNYGQLRLEARDFESALDLFRRALAVQSGIVEAEFGIGAILFEMKQYAAAIEHLDRPAPLSPEFPCLLGLCGFARAANCDWSQYEERIAGLHTYLARGKPVVSPFVMLALPTSPAIRRQAAELYVSRECPSDPRLGEPPAAAA